MSLSSVCVAGNALRLRESEAAAQVLKDLGKPFLSGTGAVSQEQ